MEIAWLIAALPLLALTLTLFNAVAWPRGSRKGAGTATVSVLIPARNEEGTIAAAVRSALAEDVLEVVVYDDGSTDRTPDILAEIAAEDPRLKIVEGNGLPPGWVGKPHACHQLSTHARGDILLFLDADVELLPGGVGRILDMMTSHTADVLTAVPRQRTETLFEHLILPLLHVTYLSWLPLPLIWRTHDPRFLAANGQVLAARAEAYRDVGGFESVRDAVVDDMAICRRFKEAKRRVVFADGHETASCRMYESAGDVWEGFSKNIFEGIGSLPGLIFVLGLYLATFVLPWIALLAGAVSGASAVLVPAGVGVAANVLQRALIAYRHRQNWIGVIVHPVAVVALCAIAVNSWLWYLKDDIVWSGRSYARKESRGG